MKAWRRTFSDDNPQTVNPPAAPRIISIVVTGDDTADVTFDQPVNSVTGVSAITVFGIPSAWTTGGTHTQQTLLFDDIISPGDPWIMTAEDPNIFPTPAVPQSGTLT